MQIGPYIIMRKTELPFIEKAHKLARAMTEDQLDDILAGKRHIHRNPRRLNVVGSDKCQANVEYQKAGE
jgi:hypothetical protein